MKLHGLFPDTEAAIRAHVEHVFPELSVYSELPDDFDVEHLPAALVTQPPGGGGFATEEYEDAGTVDVEFYAGTRAEVWELIRTYKTALPELHGWGNVAIDEIRMSQRFGIQNYDNPRIRRGLGSIDVLTRSQ